MLLKLTLQQNRSNPARYGRLIRYVRQGDRVVPYGVRLNAAGVVTKLVELKWRDIAPTEADPELVEQWHDHMGEQEQLEAETFAEAWVAHVRRQRALARAAEMQEAA